MSPATTLSRLAPLLTGAGLLPAMLHEQPSGGPIDPVAQDYRVPSEAQHGLYVAPDGLAPASGATVEEPTLLGDAFQRAETHAAILLRCGTRRTGDLLLNQGVTMRPFGAFPDND